jgi:hypothetical protein
VHLKNLSKTGQTSNYKEAAGLAISPGPFIAESPIKKASSSSPFLKKDLGGF